MNMGKEEGGGVAVVMRNRAEIDTSAPFQSVKEAVMLFGERVLAGEVYANQLKQMKAAAGEYGPNSSASSKIGTMTAELQETKQNLDKAKEEGMLMANCLDSLKQELENTKRELQLLKTRKESEMQIVQEDDFEMEEDLKFMEQQPPTKNIQVMTPTSTQAVGVDKQQLRTEFERKRSVQFASPPSLERVMSPLGEYTTKATEEQMLQRHPSLKNKKKKKPLIPLIGGIFSKFKGNNHGVASPKVRAP